jgi:hypothetical protein
MQSGHMIHRPSFLQSFCRFEQVCRHHALFVGQSTILSLTVDQGIGEAYCPAHHLNVDGGKRRLMVSALRYLASFVKMDGAWLFAERLLYFD